MPARIAGMLLATVAVLAGCAAQNVQPTVLVVAQDVLTFVPSGGPLQGDFGGHCANPAVTSDPPGLTYYHFSANPDVHPDARPAGVLTRHFQVPPPPPNTSTGGDATTTLVLGSEPRDVVSPLAGGPLLLRAQLRGDAVLLDEVPLLPGGHAERAFDYRVVWGNVTLTVHEVLTFSNLGRVTPQIQEAMGCA